MIKLSKNILFITILIFFLHVSNSIVFADAPTPWQMGVQEPATELMVSIMKFHNLVLVVIAAIGLTVVFLIADILTQHGVYKDPFSFHWNGFNQWRLLMGLTKIWPPVNLNRKYVPFRKIGMGPMAFTHSSVLEFIWTVIPAVILIYIAGPSFTLLYSLDRNIDTCHAVVKIIGHQWYWTYEVPRPSLDYDESLGAKKYSTFNAYAKDFESNFLNVSNCVGFRLLETNPTLFLPWNRWITLIITSSDVIHSWAVPSFGIKLDACPGRLSHISFYVNKMGMYYGQCSEICGAGHGFMPIAIGVVPERIWQDSLKWYQWTTDEDNSDLPFRGEYPYNIDWISQLRLYA